MKRKEIERLRAVEAEYIWHREELVKHLNGRVADAGDAVDPSPRCVAAMALRARKRIDELSAPAPMLLWCPSCGERHIDVGEFATKPHHTHACQACGMVWRPAVQCTVGVQFLPGFRDQL